MCVCVANRERALRGRRDQRKKKKRERCLSLPQSLSLSCYLHNIYVLYTKSSFANHYFAQREFFRDRQLIIHKVDHHAQHTYTSALATTTKPHFYHTCETGG